jgi:hypothetical protein
MVMSHILMEKLSQGRIKMMGLLGYPYVMVNGNTKTSIMVDQCVHI